MKSIYFLISTVVLVVAFNNCSNQGQFTGMSDSSSSSGSSGSDLESLDYDGNLVRSSSSSSGLKLSISKSLNGGYEDSLKVCAGTNLYFKTSGVKSPKTAKGCASPAGSTDCLDLRKHRSFLDSEIINGDIITVVTAEQSKEWIGSFDFYLLEDIDASSKKFTKVASASINNCDSAGNIVASTCDWKMITPPRAVIGGGPTAMPPDAKCSRAILNSEQWGVYRVYTAEVGTQSDYKYRCECK